MLPAVLASFYFVEVISSRHDFIDDCMHFSTAGCVKSILLRGPYAEVVKDIEESTSMAKISTSLNRVNCFDWEDVCRKQGIFTYPVIVVYR